MSLVETADKMLLVESEIRKLIAERDRLAQDLKTALEYAGQKHSRPDSRDACVPIAEGSLEDSVVALLQQRHMTCNVSHAVLRTLQDGAPPADAVLNLIRYLFNVKNTYEKDLYRMHALSSAHYALPNVEGGAGVSDWLDSLKATASKEYVDGYARFGQTTARLVVEALEAGDRACRCRFEDYPEDVCPHQRDCDEAHRDAVAALKKHVEGGGGT